MTKEEKIAELTKLITPEGFKNEILHSDEIWRGDPELFDWIASRMNICTTELIQALGKNVPDRKLRTILNFHLRKFRRIDFETEDAEFIAECFELVSTIAGIRFGSRLMRWLYGIPVWLLMKIVRFFRPEKTLAINKQVCEKCGAEFRMILKKVGGQSDSQWVIGQCLSCNTYNLAETFSNGRLTTYSNFYPKEYLDKDEFNEEQATIRLEQIRYWRKQS